MNIPNVYFRKLRGKEKTLIFVVRFLSFFLLKRKMKSSDSSLILYAMPLYKALAPGTVLVAVSEIHIRVNLKLH